MTPPRPLHCSFDDAELVRIEAAAGGPVRLHFSAVPAERPSPWQRAPEVGWLPSVVLQLDGVAPTALWPTGLVGRVRELVLSVAGATPSGWRKWPCPGQQAGPLTLQLVMAQGDVLTLQAQAAQWGLADGGDPAASFQPSLAC